MQVTVRVGVSFNSVDQARANIDAGTPDGRAFEQTAHDARKAWKDKLGLIEIADAIKANLTAFYSAFFSRFAGACHPFLVPSNPWLTYDA